MRTRILFFLLACSAPHASPHITMLLPDSPYGKKDEAVTLVYQWGHPFENQLFDAPPPSRVFVLTPEGKTMELAKSLEKIKKKSAETKEAQAFRFKFTPPSRGDYTFILNTPPIWLADSKEFLQDSVKVVVHVQAQKRWDAESGKGFRIMPLTRPYGLLPGMTFQARVLDREVINPDAPEIPAKVGGLGGLFVQYERYNAVPPKTVPSDELVTFATKTDPNGVATCTLPDAGWWCLVAQRDAGKRAYDGKDYPLRQRVILWVHVDEKTAK